MVTDRNSLNDDRQTDSHTPNLEMLSHLIKGIHKDMIQANYDE